MGVSLGFVARLAWSHLHTCKLFFSSMHANSHFAALAPTDESKCGRPKSLHVCVCVCVCVGVCVSVSVFVSLCVWVGVFLLRDKESFEPVVSPPTPFLLSLCRSVFLLLLLLFIICLFSLMFSHVLPSQHRSAKSCSSTLATPTHRRPATASPVSTGRCAVLYCAGLYLISLTFPHAHTQTHACTHARNTTRTHARVSVEFAVGPLTLNNPSRCTPTSGRRRC
jgi:hypothetical protein